MELKLMRKSMLSLMAIAAVVVAGLTAVPAFADDDDRTFSPGDGRFKPKIGEQVAVYCQDDGVAVWGIDGNLNGHYLTTFSAAELSSGATLTHTTAQGNVTLRQDQAAKTYFSYANAEDTTLDEYVDESAAYTISWSGGTHGATGSGAFSKQFECTYLPE
jgi:phage baseplate assembly protein gpV